MITDRDDDEELYLRLCDKHALRVAKFMDKPTDEGSEFFVEPDEMIIVARMAHPLVRLQILGDNVAKDTELRPSVCVDVVVPEVHDVDMSRVAPYALSFDVGCVENYV